MIVTCGSSQTFRSARDLLRQVGLVRYQQIPLHALAFPVELYDETAQYEALLPAQLLLPLFVTENGGGVYSVIDGCKRLSFFKKENRAECACGIMAAGTPFQSGIARILLNRGRSLTVNEQFIFYKWLKAYGVLTEKSCAEEFLDLPWKRITELEMLTNCPADVQAAVFSHRLHPQNVPDFHVLGENDRAAFLAMFAGLELSQQAQHEFIQWMAETACAQKTAFTGIKEFPEIETIILDKALNAPQKIEKIRSLLHSIRFPRFDAVLKNWNKTAHEINPAPLKVSFIADPYFEKNRLEVRVKVSSPDDAKEIFGKLAGISAEKWSGLTVPGL
jgi:hypothetical protein